MSTARNLIHQPRAWRPIQWGCAALFAITALYWLLQTLGAPLPYVMVSRLHLLILLSGELLIAVLVIPRNLGRPWDARRVGRLARDFLVANAIFLFPFVKFYTNLQRDSVLLIHQARPYLLAGYLALLLAGTLLLWALGDLGRASAWIIARLDAQKSADDRAFALRRAEFSKRSPGLARIPLLGSLSRWVYSEGTGWGLALFFVAGLGLVLRLWRLGELPPYIDEYHHLNTARDLLLGVPLGDLEYRRSLYTVTLPVWLSFGTLGQSLWAARLPGVLANVLACLPLYALARRINKPVALLAVALFSLSPWVIAASRNVREYAVYPLVLYTLGLVMLWLYEALPEQIDFLRDARLLFGRRNLFYLGSLVLVLGYAVFVDPKSTLKMSLVLYLALGLLIARKIDWRRPANWAIVVFILALLIFGLANINKALGSRYFLANLEHRNYAFFPFLFFEKPVQQWYFDRSLVSLVIFALALLATPLWNRRKFVLPFSLLVFLGGLAAISFFYLKGERPRYAMNIEIWYTLLVAAGLFAALALGEQLAGRRFRWLAWPVILLLFWNFPQTLMAALHVQPGWHPVTLEYHADMAPAFDYLSAHAALGETIVSTDFVNLYQRYYRPTAFSGHPLVRFDPAEPAAYQTIFDAIQTNPSGWILLDRPRGFDWSRPLEMRDFEYQGRQVHYLGWFGDVYMYQW
jgi:hypothetical protein